MPASVAPVVVVPTTLFSAEAERCYEQAGAQLRWLLPEDERTVGFGDVGPRAAAPPAVDVRAVAARVDAALAEALPRADALHAIGVGEQLPVTAAMLERAPRLRVVLVPAAGTDAVDVDAATAHGVAVINAGGVYFRPVAEHTLGLMLALVRRIARLDREARSATGAVASGIALGNRPPLLHGATLGIVGLGFAGREVARQCRAAFGMRVIGLDPQLHPAEASRLGIELVDELADLLEPSDVVSLHAPLLPSTAGLIDADALAAMRPSASLINTARGGLVDTDALVAALRDGRLAGAALDVTAPEPLPRDHPLRALDNVVLTPHVAGASTGALPTAALSVAREAMRALRGERPWNLVNPAVWERRRRGD